MKKSKRILKEIFTIDPERGAAASLVGLSKSGYKMTNIDRKGTKCTVTFEKYE
jgi:hypothetical protein